MQRSGVIRPSVAALLALSIGCATGEPAGEAAALPATGLVAHAEQVSPPVNREAGKTVFVELPSGTKLRDVLDLRLFGSLVPGKTCEEAAIVLGVGGRYVDSCTFELPSAKVYVAYEPSHSLGGTYHRRTLYGYPKAEHGDADTIISSHLKSYRTLAAPGVILELIIAENGDNQRAWVLVDGDSVRSINWLSPTSRRGPDRPRAEQR